MRASRRQVGRDQTKRDLGVEHLHEHVHEGREFLALLFRGAQREVLLAR